MKLQQLQEIPETVEQELASYSPLLRRLLLNRNIQTRENAYRFLFPSFEKHSFDPFLLKDIDKAIERIKIAIEKNEKIAVYADYDCDGIPGAVLMNDFLQMLKYSNFVVYIPDRHREGYGLQIDALKNLIADGVKLIITVDLGITNNEEVAYCQEHGIDVIITDHHLVGEKTPDAFAVINPKQETCQYPDEMLCGTGVAFKLVQGFLEKYRELFNIPLGQEKWLLDMVGLATLSDMVPLTNENRVFAYYGLIVFRKTRRKGLIHLMKKAGLNSLTLLEEDIAFSITPRINAAGRMAHPRDAFDLLSAVSNDDALEKSNLLHTYNETRKKLVQQIMKKAHAKLSSREKNSIIVVGDRDWAIGVLGLIASRLVEVYGCPVFVWGGSPEDDLLKGSCRSDGTVSVVELMNETKNHFHTFGGHTLAGGFSLSVSSVHTLEQNLLESYEKIKTEKSPEKIYHYDAEMSFDNVSFETYNEIQKLAPFGVGNPKPVFLFRDCIVTSVKIFGKQNEHLELSFRTSLGKIIKAIAFFTRYDSFGMPISEGACIQLFASIEKSVFGYKTEIRLRIEDIHFLG